MFGRKKKRENYDTLKRIKKQIDSRSPVFDQIDIPEEHTAQEETKEQIIRRLQKKTNIFDFTRFAFIGSIILIVAFSYMLSEQQGLLLVMFLLGSTMFLPVGLLVGWFFMDPYNRAKAYRFLFKKNYGIIFLKGHGKNIISKIKNLDDSLIWVGNKLWHISPNEIRILGKNEETIQISAEDFNYLAGVPVLFFSIDSMKPLKFEMEKSITAPEELGSALKGWNFNQIAKILFFKRNIQIMMIIVAALAGMAMFFAFQNQQILQNEIQPAIDSIKNMVPKAAANVTIGG